MPGRPRRAPFLHASPQPRLTPFSAVLVLYPRAAWSAVSDDKALPHALVSANKTGSDTVYVHYGTGVSVRC